MDSVKKALLVALEVELHAAEYFEKLGRMATTEDGRRLYGELAEEERAHAGEIERLLG
jgi:rubrerythrin